MKICVTKIILIVYVIGILVPMNAIAFVFSDSHPEEIQVVAESIIADHGVLMDSHDDTHHFGTDNECEGGIGCGLCLCAASCSSLLTWPHKRFTGAR